MKKTITFLFAIVISTVLFAQKGKEKTKENNPKKEARETVLGNEKGKNNSGTTTEESNSKTKSENKSAKSKDNNDNPIWDGTKDKDGGGPKASKNQPAKVRAAFAKDYPAATNVSWSKYRGDWTASFNSGVFRSTAVYHANGQRKDTRTVIEQPQLPKRIVEIFRKKPTVKMEDIVKIEVPESTKNIYRIKTIETDTPKFNFYDTDGNEVKYDY